MNYQAVGPRFKPRIKRGLNKRLPLFEKEGSSADQNVIKITSSLSSNTSSLVFTLKYSSSIPGVVNFYEEGSGKIRTWAPDTIGL